MLSCDRVDCRRSDETWLLETVSAGTAGRHDDRVRARVAGVSTTEADRVCVRVRVLLADRIGVTRRLPHTAQFGYTGGDLTSVTDALNAVQRQFMESSRRTGTTTPVI